MERKLAAILAADVVGYSAQMERDEAGTFARVTARRKDIFEPAIARHQGRIFKLMGDGILAEFGSVVQAVECAVALQAALEERNRDVPEDQAIRARIGINLGEVIVDGDDRYGEGVNIAARLEGLAEPGGICVSEKVAREVERKLAFGFEAMGAQQLKNIAQPVLAFRVSRLPTLRPKPGIWRSRGMVLAGAVAALVVAAFAVMWAIQQTQTPLLRAAPLSMAILRFANLTGDPERDFVTVSFPDNIATILGSSPLLRYTEFIADRNAAQPGGVRAIAGDLRVDLVLDGSIGVAAPGVSFTGRVYDGQSGNVLTTLAAEVPDGDLARLQYLIAKAAVDAVATLTGDGADAALDPEWAKTSAQTDEYNFVLRSLAAQYDSAFSGDDNALGVLESGLARHPQSVLLRLSKAYILSERAQFGPDEARWDEAQAAWALLSDLPEASTLPLQERWFLHVVRAQVTPRATGDFEAAMRDAEQANRLVPYFPRANIRLSEVAANAGHGAPAVEWVRVGMNPDRRPSDWQREVLAWALLVDGRPEEALAEYSQVWHHCLPCEVVALVQTGRMDKARALVAQIRRDAPYMTVARESTWPTGHQPFLAEPLLSTYLGDLRKAGLPETAPPAPPP